MIDPNSSQTPTFNPWNYKPWWCQPWSILLTGISLILGSWFVFHTLWITILVAIPLCAWMGFFLLLWPKLMAEVYEQEYLSNKDSEDDYPLIG